MCMSIFIGLYGHTIKKYNSFGDLVQVLGTPGKKGTGLNPLQFDNPAELYVEDTGDIYIVDGDGGLNNRLIKLSQGTWLSFVWYYCNTLKLKEPFGQSNIRMLLNKLDLICLVLSITSVFASVFTFLSSLCVSLSQISSPFSYKGTSHWIQGLL